MRRRIRVDGVVGLPPCRRGNLSVRGTQYGTQGQLRNDRRELGGVLHGSEPVEGGSGRGTERALEAERRGRRARENDTVPESQSPLPCLLSRTPSDEMPRRVSSSTSWIGQCDCHRLSAGR